MTEDPAQDDFPRRHLGRFELVRRLDVGGMAEIFLALERGVHDFERLVVIKRALPHLAQKRAFREMFLQEARFVARLNHPNIVQIYELGEAEGAAFIAMEHVFGTSFRDLVRTAVEGERQFPFGVVVGLVAQACAGAHAAHELADPSGKPLGLVHRDISPHNLMVTAGGHVKLLDFGIAKATELGIDTTRTGALKGKVHYMSPEQVLQDKLDRRSDVFALGIVAWELLTSRRLFKRDHEMATMQAITAGDAWQPGEFRGGIPEGVARVVMKALEVDRAKRHATADDFRRELEAAADEAGLKHGTDEVAAFVKEQMAGALAENERAVKDAVERVKREGYIDPQTPPDGQRAPGGRKVTNTETLPRAAISTRVSQGLGVSTRHLRVAGLVALFAASIGVGLGLVVFRRPALDGPELRIGWAPTVDPKVLAQDIEPLRLHLEAQTGRPVTFVHATSYHDLADRLLDGGVEYASLPPTLYVRTERREPRLKAVALKLVGGSSGTDGVLLAAEGSGISTVADLKGKTLCIPDEDSTTGALFPKLAVRKAGLDWGRDITVVKTGNHLQSLRDLTARKCDAAGTYSTAFVSAVTQGVDVTSLRQVAITGRSPQDSIVAGPGVPAKDVAALQKALFSYKPPGGTAASAGSMERITGFVAPKPEDYAALREVVALEDGRAR